MAIYAVKSIFRTLQGEGAQVGRAAVFCRFSGCNLWSGLESNRAEAICRFCDTDFVGVDGNGGGKFNDAEELADAIDQTWGLGQNRRFVVFTGGEPLLQLNETLLRAVARRGFETAVETNGTLHAPGSLDWVCVSPKAGAPLKITIGSELKVVFPQAGLNPERLASLRFDHFWLQPMDGPNRNANTAAAVRYCLDHPQWRLSTQIHKGIGIS